MGIDLALYDQPTTLKSVEASPVPGTESEDGSNGSVLNLV